eukprot:EG_transcript_3338
MNSPRPPNLSVKSSPETLSPRRSSYAPDLTPLSPASLRLKNLARVKPCGYLSDSDAPTTHRVHSALFRLIVERGERRGSNYPVIDSLYPLHMSETSTSSSSSCRVPPLSLPKQRVDGPSSEAEQDPFPLPRTTSRLVTVVPASPREGEGKCCVTVAVRVRPFAKAEAAEARSPVLGRDGRTLTLLEAPRPKAGPPQQFTFDEVLWSAPLPDPAAASLPASQQDVYEALGAPLLQNLVRGYNACLLCYGQTGSGKTYTMMGTAAEPGLVPRYAEAVFQCLEDQQRANDISAYRVQMSYLEIYNEKVNDLLASDGPGLGKAPRSPRPVQKHLRVRQHPVRGPFVEGLTQHAVAAGAAILALLRQGNDRRATAATRMNDRSSRSHAIVTLELAQQALITQTGCEDLFSSKTSRVFLVDLAGSERTTKSDVHSGARFQELTCINQSLSTLSRVIETLSEYANSGTKLPPYRESTLTWLLADSFGGNSKTTMIATVSPAASNSSETLSTLRYASRARRIVNKAVINEDPSGALISALQAETQQLRAQLAEMAETNSLLKESRGTVEEVERLRNKLCFSDKLIEELKEHEQNERMAWEMRFQWLNLKHEKHEARQLEMQRSCEATEKQLETARAEVRRKAEEVAALHQALAEKEGEIAARAGYQQQLQHEISTKEAEIHDREAQLQAIHTERERLEQRNSEMLAEIGREVALREAEFQERQRWEQRAKAMEQRLQEEIAQRQGRIAVEQTLLEVLQGDREAMLQSDSRVVTNHGQLMATVGRLEAEHRHLQATLAAEGERHRGRERDLEAELAKAAEHLHHLEALLARAPPA